MSADAPVLSVRDLSVRYGSGGAEVSAVSDVSLEVRRGEILGLVGESGCGKTTLSLALMGLLPPTTTVGGSVRLEGEELTGLSEGRRRRIRGDRMAMIFQDPLTSLDPTHSIGSQVAEAITAHRSVSRREAKAKAVRLLSDVGIPDAESRYGEPPHRFSGGMRQRVVIAAALANEPALLLADEPTTALDVTIQAQILTLLRRLRDEHGTTIVLITHDLGVVAQLCDRVGVMYAGQLVETAPVEELFARPRHPYTRALLAALPTSGQPRGSLRVIEGQVPDLSDPPPGCRFLSRCAERLPECVELPLLAPAAGDREIACWTAPETREAAS